MASFKPVLHRSIQVVLIGAAILIGMALPSQAVTMTGTTSVTSVTSVTSAISVATVPTVTNTFTAHKGIGLFSYHTAWTTRSVAPDFYGTGSYRASVSNNGCGSSVCNHMATVTYYFLGEKGNLIKSFIDRMPVKNLRSAHTLSWNLRPDRVTITVNVDGDKGILEGGGLGKFGPLGPQVIADELPTQWVYTW